MSSDEKMTTEGRAGLVERLLELAVLLDAVPTTELEIDARDLLREAASALSGQNTAASGSPSKLPGARNPEPAAGAVTAGTSLPPQERVELAICRSHAFETGEGTCAVICMESFGDPRKKGCPHAKRVHKRLADAIAALSPPVGQAPDGLEPYDAGLLGDYGGGNVEWWQDYMRAELGRAHDFYVSQVSRLPDGGDSDVG